MSWRTPNTYRKAGAERGTATSSSTRPGTSSPGRVCTRTQLLDQIWGSDFLGGPRTVDVHIRRLRAKLGADHEALIGTIRNVGYRAIPPGTTRRFAQAEPEPPSEPSPPREPRQAEPSTRDGYTGIR